MMHEKIIFCFVWNCSASISIYSVMTETKGQNLVMKNSSSKVKQKPVFVIWVLAGKED